MGRVVLAIVLLSGLLLALERPAKSPLDLRKLKGIPQLSLKFWKVLI